MHSKRRTTPLFFKKISSFFSLLVAIFFIEACVTSTKPNITTPVAITTIQPTSTKTISPTITASSTPSRTSTKIPSIFTPTLPHSPHPSSTRTATATLPPLPTLPTLCGKVELGEPGTQTQDSSLDVLIQGTAILCGQMYFSTEGPPQTISANEAQLDLDTGSIGISEEADIEFYPGGGSMIFYSIAQAGKAQVQPWTLYLFKKEHPPYPTYEDCKNLINLWSSDNEPDYVCVITNLGNVSRVKVETFNPLGKYVLSLEISFITWRDPYFLDQQRHNKTNEFISQQK